MTPPSGESGTLNTLLEEDLEAVVDYGSDTSFIDHYESKTDTLTCEAAHLIRSQNVVSRAR